MASNAMIAESAIRGIRGARFRRIPPGTHLAYGDGSATMLSSSGA
jgi:hypothetical protein